MTKRVTSLLFEAFRRNEMANTDPHWEGEAVTRRWLGLGIEAAYRPAIEAGLFMFHDGRTPPPRCMGWLCLTEAGAKAMQEHEAEFRDALEDMKRCGYEDNVYAHYTLAGGITT